MTDRQILWGVSNGVTVFALAGAFWIGLGIATLSARAHWLVLAFGTVIQVAGCAILIRAALRLRRKSGFRQSDLRSLAGGSRAETRRILIWFVGTIVVQMVLIGLAVWACVYGHAESLIWPSIGLVVSLHLAPLAWVFHVPAYYGTAVAGTTVALIGLMTSTGPYGAPFLGAGMAAVMWLSALYLLAKADIIAKRAREEQWTV